MQNNFNFFTDLGIIGIIFLALGVLIFLVFIIKLAIYAHKLFTSEYPVGRYSPIQTGLFLFVWLFIFTLLPLLNTPTNTSYEFTTSDGNLHRGPSCWLSGGLFTTDGMRCRDYDGVVYTEITSYKQVTQEGE